MAKVPIGEGGNFKGGDIRDWLGCFVGRGVHSNPQAKSEVTPASHLNAVGSWLKDSVMKDGKGLYCTNCHNLGSRLLYKSDQLQDAIAPTGTTLRNKSMEEIVAAFRKMEGGKYKDYSIADFFDPRVAPVDRVADVWRDAASPPYDKVDDGGDYWLAAGEPHCADCHQAPFVEGMGGTYFPLDQPGKYALMRYSKGHHGVSCQSCHESTHGLYPVNPGGPDPISYAQAAALNPDGSHGPVKCAACHVVDKEGIPTMLSNALLAGFSDRDYPTRYERAVAYAHTRRIDAERRVKATSSRKN